MGYNRTMRTHASKLGALRGPMLGVVAALSSCARELPPLGEVVLVVDTDVPVPAVGGTLRIDVLRRDAGGDLTWLDSREVVREDARDWPASFSVYAPEGTGPTEAVVRLRLYASGKTRDYRGERFFDLPNADGDPNERFHAPPAPVGEGPRLRRGGLDLTPVAEPDPLVTIDRLVRVTLTEGRRATAAVLLAGECAGTMANLATLETCTDTARTRAPSTEPEAASSAAPSRVGTWPLRAHPLLRTPCDGAAQPEDRRCVPGGAFIVGDRSASGSNIDADVEIQSESAPERVAVVLPFVSDVFEVTVARYRRALAAGFSAKSGGPQPNDGPITVGNERTECTFSTSPRDREDYPVNCVSIPEAHAFCAHEGGRLPSEVEWEYLATNGFTGRRKTTLPWGNDTAYPCEGVVVERTLTSGIGRCKRVGLGPAPVDLVLRTPAVGSVDRNLLGIVGLVGNVVELTADTAASYSSRCWLASPFEHTGCDASYARFGGTYRGDSWYNAPSYPTRRVISNLVRGDEGGRSSSNGFRCVYDLVGRAP